VALWRAAASLTGVLPAAARTSLLATSPTPPLPVTHFLRDFNFLGGFHGNRRCAACRLAERLQQRCRHHRCFFPE